MSTDRRRIVLGLARSSGRDWHKAKARMSIAIACVMTAALGVTLTERRNDPQ